MHSGAIRDSRRRAKRATENVQIEQSSYNSHRGKVWEDIEKAINSERGQDVHGCNLVRAWTMYSISAKKVYSRGRTKGSSVWSYRMQSPASITFFSSDRGEGLEEELSLVGDKKVAAPLTVVVLRRPPWKLLVRRSAYGLCPCSTAAFLPIVGKWQADSIGCTLPRFRTFYTTI